MDNQSMTEYGSGTASQPKAKTLEELNAGLASTHQAELSPLDKLTARIEALEASHVDLMKKLETAHRALVKYGMIG